VGERDRVSELLDRTPRDGAEDVFSRNESLLGYREGIEFALTLLPAPAAADEPPPAPEAPAAPRAERLLTPEPELREQIGRVRDIET
jgi:hypothetical protein